MSGAAEVEILGSGVFSGAASAIGHYSVSEDATPLSMTDLGGGVGGVTFSATEETGFNGSILLRGEPFRLSDPFSGTIDGIIDNLSVSEETSMAIDGSTLLLPLVSVRSAAPYSGTLGGAINTYMALCGITSGIQIDSTIAAKTVALPSWTAEVWTQLKKLGAIHKFEIAGVADAIVIRPLRTRALDVTKYSSFRYNYGRDDAAAEVQVYYYQNALASNSQVYPIAGTTLNDRNIISVDASETTVVNVPVNMWISSVTPPTQQTNLGPSDSAVSSQYAVVDKDGQPVSIGDWTNGGGYMKLAIGADGKSVDITVRGSSTQYRAPYRIASSSQDRTYQYAALYIVATGIAFNRQMVYSGTGANALDAPVDDITVIDDPLVSSVADAYNVLSNAVRKATGHSQSIEVTTSKVNRRGDTGQIVYPTFGEFDATIGSSTFTTYNATITGKTFKQWNATQAAIVQKDFANQAFGSICGARVQYRDAVFRVTSATSTPGEYSWKAEADTVYSEFDANWTTKTFTQFNTFWSGKTFSQLALSPLAH